MRAARQRSRVALPFRADLLYDGDGALADERDGHRLGADAVARDAAGGVGGGEEGQRCRNLGCGHRIDAHLLREVLRRTVKLEIRE